MNNQQTIHPGDRGNMPQVLLHAIPLPGDPASNAGTVSGGILVVEDDMDIRIILHHRLTNAGYPVAAFSNGYDALEWLNHNTPVLAILDVLLPGMDGHQICQSLRAHGREEIRTLPIIMVTALQEDATKHRGYREGATMFLRKPVFSNRLLRHIETLLQQSECYPRDLPGEQ